MLYPLSYRCRTRSIVLGGDGCKQVMSRLEVVRKSDSGDGRLAFAEANHETVASDHLGAENGSEISVVGHDQFRLLFLTGFLRSDASY